MTKRNALPMLPILLVLLSMVGCAASDDEPVTGAGAAEAATPVETAGEDPVTRAVAVAKALEAEPDNAVEVLERASMTPEEYEALMYEIAADPEMTRAYRNAMGEE